jgi:hypothetical protein
MEDETVEVYQEFDKCVPGAGPHGHIAATEREWVGSRGSGKMMFSWKCAQCRQRSKKAVVVFVDRHGLVL